MVEWVYQCRICKSNYNDDGDIINKICVECEDTPEAEEIYKSLKYTFEETSEGQYMVFLAAEFIAYTNHTDEQEVDQYLKNEGYNSRSEYLNRSINKP
jgi:hypothetical protein